MLRLHQLRLQKIEGRSQLAPNDEIGARKRSHEWPAPQKPRIKTPQKPRIKIRKTRRMQAGGLKFRMPWFPGLRSVAALGPPILTRSPLASRSAFTSTSLFFFRAPIFSAPPFDGFSSVPP